MLPYDAPDVAPPPALRARILSAVEESGAAVVGDVPIVPPQAHEETPVAARPQRRRWRLPSFQLAYGFALVALIGLLAWNIALQRRLNTQSAQLTASRASWQTMIVLLNDSKVRWYPVTGVGAAGHFWAAPQGEVGCLVVQGLPALKDDQVFQVWLVHNGQHVSGGVFEAREGNGWILIRAKESLSNYEVVGVTVEPRGGSVEPTSPPVLQGQLASAHMPTIADRQLLAELIAPLRD
jgi:hypothetical protein